MFIRFDRMYERDRHTNGQTRQKSSDFDEIWYTTADLELGISYTTKYENFKIQDGGRPPYIGHNLAADCLISVKCCTGKQNSRR